MKEDKMKMTDQEEIHEQKVRDAQVLSHIVTEFRNVCEIDSSLLQSIQLLISDNITSHKKEIVHHNLFEVDECFNALEADYIYDRVETVELARKITVSCIEQIQMLVKIKRLSTE